MKSGCKHSEMLPSPKILKFTVDYFTVCDAKLYKEASSSAIKETESVFLFHKWHLPSWWSFFTPYLSISALLPSPPLAPCLPPSYLLRFHKWPPPFLSLSYPLQGPIFPLLSLALNSAQQTQQGSKLLSSITGPIREVLHFLWCVLSLTLFSSCQCFSASPIPLSLSLFLSLAQGCVIPGSLNTAVAVNPIY